MNMLKKAFAGAALALAASGASAVTLSPDTWVAFDAYDDVLTGRWVDENLAPLSFEFVLTGPAVLTVVDGGLAGDRFRVFGSGYGNAELGATSLPADAGDTSQGIDFDAALADPRWSRAMFQLAPGAYSVTGEVMAFAAGTTATVGGLMLTPVPEPSTYALSAVGIALCAMALRRRRV